MIQNLLIYLPDQYDMRIKDVSSVLPDNPGLLLDHLMSGVFYPVQSSLWGPEYRCSNPCLWAGLHRILRSGVPPGVGNGQSGRQSQYNWPVVRYGPAGLRHQFHRLLFYWSNHTYQRYTGSTYHRREHRMAHNDPSTSYPMILDQLYWVWE